MGVGGGLEVGGPHTYIYSLVHMRTPMVHMSIPYGTAVLTQEQLFPG